MAISLNKGGNLSLTKTDPTLRKISVGLGWDVRATSGAAFDLDASCFLCGETGKVRSDADFIFYNQLRSTDGSVEHTGDNLTGEGEGDDEQINVDLTSISLDIFKLAFTVTIHDAEVRHQNFGQIATAFIRIVNAETNNEIVRYDLSEDASTETAMIIGELNFLTARKILHRRLSEGRLKEPGRLLLEACALAQSDTDTVCCRKQELRY